MTTNEKKEWLPYALGQKKCELVLKNANIIDVFTSKIRTADVAVQNGSIVGVGDYQGIKEFDLTGKYLSPGFIDAHVHTESSMVSPRLFAQKILPCGTTTIVADPHEIANVAGLDGVEYLLKDSENACVSIYFMLPSCVPLNEFDHNGAVFDVEQMKKLMYHPHVLGLGEVMNYDAVMNQDDELFKKISLMQNKVIDGHAPSLSGKELQAYRLAGVQTDHECSTYEEALERIQTGFYVQIREGSAAKNLEAVLSGALQDGIDFNRFVFCTDDMHLDDIANHGHINYVIQKAIQIGVNPVEAIKMATFNPAQLYGLNDRGAIAPGYSADLVVLNDLQSVKIDSVYKNGIRYESGSHATIATVPEKILHSVHIPKLSLECLAMKANENFPVIEVLPGQITTKKVMMPLPQKNGVFVPQNDILKIAVVQRHDGSGRIGLGAIKGFGLKNGAIASTISHDSHNLIVVGDNDTDMLCAIEELTRCNGGYTIISEGKAVKTLPLPIAGLFTSDEGNDLIFNLNEMVAISHKMGIPKGIDPFLNLSFASLPVIPEIRITDSGIFDVTQNCFLTI